MVSEQIDHRDYALCGAEWDAICSAALVPLSWWYDAQEQIQYAQICQSSEKATLVLFYFQVI